MKKSEAEIESWLGLIRTYNKALHLILNDLKEEGLPPLDWYDVLWALEKEQGHKLRLIDICEKMDLEKYSVTRIVDKLVDEKLVEKNKCPMDKRGAHACLTEKGRKLRQRMWLSYKKSIARHFGSQFTLEESLTLIKILGKN